MILVYGHVLLGPIVLLADPFVQDREWRLSLQYNISITNGKWMITASVRVYVGSRDIIENLQLSSKPTEQP